MSKGSLWRWWTVYSARCIRSGWSHFVQSREEETEGKPHCSLQLPRQWERQLIHFSLVSSNRTCMKLHQVGCFFTEKVIEHWNRFSRDAVVAPSLLKKKHLDNTLRHVIWFLCGHVQNRELDLMSLVDPFQLGKFCNSKYKHGVKKYSPNFNLHFPIRCEFYLIPLPISYILLKYQSNNKYSVMFVFAWMCLSLAIFVCFLLFQKEKKKKILSLYSFSCALVISHALYSMSAG